MESYTFSAERQLFFYVNVKGQQRLVKFGDRNAYGASVFTTMLRETAEAIRRHSLYKRGVIKEQVTEKPQAVQAPTPTPKVVNKPVAKVATQTQQTKPATKEPTTTAAPEQTTKKELLEARNFTQAKSLLAKKLGIAYSDIKTPDQLMQLAKQAGIEVVYSK